MPSLVNYLPPESLAEALQRPGWSAQKFHNLQLSDIRGKAFKNQHRTRLFQSYAMEIVIGGERCKTERQRSNFGQILGWKDTVFSARTSDPDTEYSNIRIRVYCHHLFSVREDHMIAEAMFSVLPVDTDIVKEMQIPLFNSDNPKQRKLVGYITLRVEFGESLLFSRGNYNVMVG